MKTHKVIRSNAQYQECIQELQLLLEKKSALSNSDLDALDLLSLIIEDYEKRIFPISQVDPVEAIRFRMAEAGLKQADLVPYLGTKSRVSEVLNRKRPLTVQMIRALSVALGIPAEILVGTDSNQNANTDAENVSNFPVREMINRGWVNATGKSKSDIKVLIGDYVSNLTSQLGQPAFKRSIEGDGYCSADKPSVLAWLARVSYEARDFSSHLEPEKKRQTFSTDILKDVANLSMFENGPEMAVQMVRNSGIAVVFEPALPKTLIDGASFIDATGKPVIGLTLRQDRIDNFWFTLLHELAHVCLHLKSDEIFVDNFDSSSTLKREAEANRFARESLIKRSDWARIKRTLDPGGSNISALSNEYRVNAAVIAGRYRYETKNFTILNEHVGQGEVRSKFFA